MASDKKASEGSNLQSKDIPVINPCAAGIDVGSVRHYVAVSPERSNTPVRNFGCYTPDLEDMARWLVECGVKTVAMESTGVYWIPVHQVLTEFGLDVKLVDAKHVKHVPGRKSDVSDCQWIQQLHSMGFLNGCFLPDEPIAVMREYWRQRGKLIALASREILHMHKAFEQMNLHLHKVLSDVTGVSGMRIIRAIVAGERDAVVLARMRERGVKKSESEIVKALTGNYRPEHLFILSQSLELYDVFQEKIKDCDQKLSEYMKGFEDKADPDQFERTSKTVTRRKNQPWIKELDKELFRITGVNLTAIDGIDVLTAQTVISEVGFDLSMFRSEKAFVSWLGLCPNNRITGGKVKKSRSKKSQNRLATALRIAAQSLLRSNSALGAFFRRMKAKLGAAKAITATARKLACLIYRMLRYGMSYADAGQERYEQQYREQQIKSVLKRAAILGLTVVDPCTGVVS